MLQTTFFVDKPAGYVAFLPDIPTVIYATLRSRFNLLSNAGAANFMASSSSLQFDLCAKNPNGIVQVNILGALVSTSEVFDVYFYNQSNGCVYHSYCVPIYELVYEFELGLGIRKKQKANRS
jgi:hypothetical protein